MRPGDARGDPLRAIAEVGDPMQPIAAGIALSAAAAGCDVLLAGGSQMVAVAAVLKELAASAAFERVAIGTTRWVVDDPSADVMGLACEVSPELALVAANLDFSASRHPGLREYERFLVKEGVGAGGACIAALLTPNRSLAGLHAAIDSVYDDLLGRLTSSDSPDYGRR
jgi:NaMN:DMB phosphoribosyltransferase